MLSFVWFTTIPYLIIEIFTKNNGKYVSDSKAIVGIY